MLDAKATATIAAIDKPRTDGSEDKKTRTASQTRVAWARSNTRPAASAEKVSRALTG